jgi:hypothetical protein
MLYFNSDEERAARVERMFEELHRDPAPARPSTWIMLTDPPDPVPPPPPEPVTPMTRRLWLVPKKSQA